MANIPQYNRDKYYRIMNVTQSNYANQRKRLSKDSKRADFILIYYSLAIFVYSLTDILYPDLLDKSWASYTGLILSVIVLIYSIINSKAGYPERIAKIRDALNVVKRLKREVGALPDAVPQSPLAASGNPGSTCPPSCGLACSCGSYQSCHGSTCAKLESLKKEYDEVVSGTEIRDDLDFYYTIRHLCKEHHLRPYTGKPQKGFSVAGTDPAIEELRGYISENNPGIQQLHVILLGLCHFILYIAPVVIFVLGIVIKHFSSTPPQP